MKKYQKKMAEYYNKRVKLKRLDIGDLVLRKNTTETKDPTQGKLGPTWEGPYRVIHYSRQEIITWKPWTDKGSLDHGTLSI